MANKAKHFWIEPDELERKGIDFCSLEAQGLWVNIMFFLHSSDDYGYLVRDGEPLPYETVAECCRISIDKFQTLLKELLDLNIFNLNEKGILYSPELIRLSADRLIRSQKNRDRYIPLPIRRLVLSIGRCQYCGATEKLTVDHIVPFSKGGLHRLSNFQCLCATCNRAKWTKSEEDYLQEVYGE